MTYRNSKSAKQIDELKIMRHDQTIYKAYIKDGGQSKIWSSVSINWLWIFLDSFTFESRQDLNESMYKLDIYLNDVLHHTIVTCCEYGLMRDNQLDSLYIDKIVGSKPCQK